jgi:hypothetical protein
MPVDVPAQVLSFYYCSMLDVALARSLPLQPLIAGLEAAQEPGLHRADRMRSLGLMAKARLRLGRRETALQLADQALQLIRQSMPTPYHIGDGIVATAEVYLDEWENGRGDPRLLQHAGEVCKALRGFAGRVPVGLPPAALQNGRYCELRGRRRRALQWWRQALEAARRLGMVHDEGLALYYIGVTLPPAEGLPLLRQALAICRRIGAGGDAERCVAALAQRGETAAA